MHQFVELRGQTVAATIQVETDALNVGLQDMVMTDVLNVETMMEEESVQMDA